MEIKNRTEKVINLWPDSLGEWVINFVIRGGIIMGTKDNAPWVRKLISFLFCIIAKPIKRNNFSASGGNDHRSKSNSNIGEDKHHFIGNNSQKHEGCGGGGNTGRESGSTNVNHKTVKLVKLFACNARHSR